MNVSGKYWTIILQEEDTLNHKDIDYITLRNYLTENEAYKFYAFILHDKDIDEEGILKTRHYHIIIETYNKYTKDTIINDFASKLFINKNVVSCRPIYDIKSMTRYLCHEDDKSKYQYDYDDIVTNNPFTLDDFRLYGDGSTLDLTTLLIIIDRSKSLAEVYGTIGLKNSKTYRNVIYDLWKEKQQHEFISKN